MNHERNAFRGIEKAVDAGRAVLGIAIANIIVAQLTLSPEAKDLIESILDSLLK